ncbi:hypothetical protein KPL70_007473 [Citrus sinensis]|nr:hypothetical protein KPL70_007473 [Citrus sinensis]
MKSSAISMKSAKNDDSENDSEGDAHKKYLPDENDGVLTYMIDDNVFQRHASAYIGKKDCNELLSMQALEVNVIQVYMAMLDSTILPTRKGIKPFGFICPSLVCPTNPKAAENFRSKRVEHIHDRLKKAKNGQLILMPYNPSTMTLFTAEDSKEKWNYNSKMRIVKAPKQNIIKLECGYYVLRYMKEIIADVSLLMNNFNGKKVYTQDELDEIGLLGFGWRVAGYVVGIPVVWTYVGLEDAGLLLNVCWDLVPREAAQKVIGSKWVFRIKYNPDGSISKYKARLVAKGFHQTLGVDFFETYSPVVKPCTIRVILSLVVVHNWSIRQLDVNNAFLNDILSEDVFMSQPEGFLHPQFPTHVCKLKKALYGLKQALRAWYDKLKSSMLQWEFHTSRPGIAFSVNKLSQFLNAPSVFHWQACKRVLRYRQLTANYGLQFYNTGNLTLTSFSDANWGSDLDDRKSVGGYCVYLGNNLISWSSKKQQIVSRSSTKFEYRALALTTSEMLWITYLLKELQVQLQQTLILKCDNKSAEALASNPKYH